MEKVNLLDQGVSKMPRWRGGGCRCSIPARVPAEEAMVSAREEDRWEGRGLMPKPPLEHFAVCKFVSPCSPGCIRLATRNQAVVRDRDGNTRIMGVAGTDLAQWIVHW